MAHGDIILSKWGRNYIEMGPSPAELGPKKRMLAKLTKTSEFVVIQGENFGQNYLQCDVI